MLQDTNFSHGVIQETANLDYDTESGALYESFADIFGRLIERGKTGLWGEEVVKLKYFSYRSTVPFGTDPHNEVTTEDAGYQPRIYSERYIGTKITEVCTSSSGINNWVFYKFTTAINNDLSKAEKSITEHWINIHSKLPFIDCRKAVIQAATDLFRRIQCGVTAAKAAYDAVGISDGTNTQTQTKHRFESRIRFLWSISMLPPLN